MGNLFLLRAFITVRLLVAGTLLVVMEIPLAQGWINSVCKVDLMFFRRLLI